MIYIPNRKDCTHCHVCKYDDAMCPTDCGHFEHTLDPAAVLCEVREEALALDPDASKDENIWGVAWDRGVKQVVKIIDAKIKELEG